MTPDQMSQYAVQALGGCIVAIGWWIGNAINGLSDKMERVLLKLETHESRLQSLETRETN